MAIGRIGDVINGEHFASFTSLPWAFVYTHPDSPAFLRPASHPAVLYEMIWDLALVLVIWPLRSRLRPQGMTFAMYLALYSVGRFFISFLREEHNQYVLGLNEAQIIAILVLLVTVSVAGVQGPVGAGPLRVAAGLGKRIGQWPGAYACESRRSITFRVVRSTPFHWSTRILAAMSTTAGTLGQRSAWLKAMAEHW